MLNICLLCHPNSVPISQDAAVLEWLINCTVLSVAVTSFSSGSDQWRLLHTGPRPVPIPSQFSAPSTVMALWCCLTQISCSFLSDVYVQTSRVLFPWKRHIAGTNQDFQRAVQRPKALGYLRLCLLNMTVGKGGAN